MSEVLTTIPDNSWGNEPLLIVDLDNICPSVSAALFVSNVSRGDLPSSDLQTSFTGRQGTSLKIIQSVHMDINMCLGRIWIIFTFHVEINYPSARQVTSCQVMIPHQPPAWCCCTRLASISCVMFQKYISLTKVYLSSSKPSLWRVKDWIRKETVNIMTVSSNHENWVCGMWMYVIVHEVQLKTHNIEQWWQSSSW